MNDKLLNQAKKCLAIQDVYMQSSNIRVAESFNPKYPDVSQLDWQQKQGAKDWNTSELTTNNKEVIKLLFVRYEGAFRLLPPNLSEDVKASPEKLHEATLAEVTSTFIVEYKINCDDLTEDAVRKFAAINVGYHVWPYWREYMHSISDRLRIPRITLPLYMVPPEE